MEHNDTILELSELTDGLETSLRVFVATSYLRYDEEMHRDILSEARELMIRVRESGIEQGMKNAFYSQINQIFEESYGKIRERQELIKKGEEIRRKEKELESDRRNEAYPNN